MIFSLIFGIVLLIWGGINFNKYILFVTGTKMKGTVIRAKYKEHGVRRKMSMAEITYQYEIDKKVYTNTEISDKKKHLFKTQSMKGEFIAIMVQKKSPQTSTLKSSAYYLKNCFFLLLVGLISTIVGIATI